jgi:hypothetical protein
MSATYVFLYGGFLVSLLVLGLVMTDRLSSKEHYPKVDEDEEDKRDMREHFKQERAQYRAVRRERRGEQAFRH